MTSATDRQKRVVLTVIAAASALVCLVAAAMSSVLAIVFAATTLLAVVTSLATLTSESRQPPVDHRALLEKAVREADKGRKLAIYERETGLFAHWYMTLRCTEECYRAERYDLSLSVLVIEPSRRSDPWAVQTQITDWLRQNLRKSDISSYLGNGRYAVLMPESDKKAAEKVGKRLRKALKEVDVASSTYPGNGSTFDELAAAAGRKLEEAAQPAA